MKGWGMVEEPGFAEEKKLKHWLETAKGFSKGSKPTAQPPAASSSSGLWTISAA